LHHAGGRTPAHKTMYRSIYLSQTSRNTQCDKTMIYLQNAVDLGVLRDSAHFLAEVGECREIRHHRVFQRGAAARRRVAAHKHFTSFSIRETTASNNSKLIMRFAHGDTFNTYMTTLLLRYVYYTLFFRTLAGLRYLSMGKPIS